MKENNSTLESSDSCSLQIIWVVLCIQEYCSPVQVDKTRTSARAPENFAVVGIHGVAPTKRVTGNIESSLPP
jgi:hypothetical protein